MRIQFQLLLFFSFLFAFSFAQDSTMSSDSFYRQEWESKRSADKERVLLDLVTDSNIDVKFYHLDVNINVYSPSISGMVYMQFRPTVNNLDTVVLNLCSTLYVDSVALNGVSSTPSGNNIIITLADSYNPSDLLELQIFYHGIPKTENQKGLLYTKHNGTETCISSVCTPFASHFWWPCKDGPKDKADSVYIDITIANTKIKGIPLIAVSNGNLESIDSSAIVTKTFKWRHRYPVVPYYVMVAISNYKTIEQTYIGKHSTFPLKHYVFDSSLTLPLLTVWELPAVLDRFIELYGDYPFKNEKYGMTQVMYWGAIENQTNIILTDMEWGSVSIHELSHQWFGDMITCANWHHAWLNEGFATYSEKLYYAGVYNNYTTIMRSSIPSAKSGGTVYLQDDTDPDNIFKNIIYRKGAFVLHMLRGVMGDSLFFKAIKTYVSSPIFQYGYVTTEDFRQVCEDVYGQDLHYFFEQWIYDEYYPFYKYNFTSNGTNLTTKLTIHQVQSDLNGWRPVFKMPMQIKFQFASGLDTLVRVMNDQRYQTYEYNFPDSVVGVELDPDDWVLKQDTLDAGINVGVSDLPNNASIFIYPNPTKDNINITVDRSIVGTSYVVLDAIGNEVMSGKWNAERTTINIGHLPTGVYTLKTDDIHQQAFKFMKQ